MQQTIEISKPAFLAVVNDVCRRAVVDTRYEVVDGIQKLILIYSDGSEAVFKGLRKVA